MKRFRPIAKLLKHVSKFRLLWPVTPDRRTAMDSMKILIPVDSSENSHKAFEWYLSKLHRSDNTVIIVHFISAGSDKDLHEKERKMLELQEFYETRLLQHKVEYRWLTGTGATPGEFIVKTAQDENVGMILMGPRGLGKLRKAILGSVSDYVVSKSAVPVLLYKSSSS